MALKGLFPLITHPHLPHPHPLLLQGDLFVSSGEKELVGFCAPMIGGEIRC